MFFQGFFLFQEAQTSDQVWKLASTNNRKHVSFSPSNRQKYIILRLDNLGPHQTSIMVRICENS